MTTHPDTVREFELNMDEIVRLLNDVHHIPSLVAQTGGGTATIYAGPTHKDEAGDDRYAACAGPGSYGWGQDDPSMGDIAEFNVGPDDNGEAGYVDVADVGATTEADIAKIIAAQATKNAGSVRLTAAEVDALGFDGTAQSTPAWLVTQRRESKAWCDAHNAVLHAAYAKGATPAEALAAATAAMNTWTAPSS